MGIYGLNLREDIGSIYRGVHSDYKKYKQHEPQIKAGIKTASVKIKRYNKRVKKIVSKKRSIHFPKFI